MAFVESDRDAPPVAAVVGPTASGKTELSLLICEAAGGEAVNFDSMQVYRGLDVGTAKPTPEERARAPHHLFDILEPDALFSADDYRARADAVVAEIRRRGRRAVLVGGTGLYLRAFLYGLFEGPEADEAVRARLKAEAQAGGGPEALHRRLAGVDPEAAERIHPRDLVRLVRALEVHELTGRPISAWRREHRGGRPRYPYLKLGLRLPREELRRRIERRAEAMFAAGLVEEVRGLLEKGYTPDLRPLQALGYKQVCEHLAGRLSLEEALERVKIETARYAKRQMTWFEKEREIEWFVPEETDAAVRRALRFWGAMG